MAKKEIKKEEVEEVDEDFGDIKQGKSHTGLIIFLLLVILGLGFYILYDKGIILKPKESEKPVQNTEKPKDEEPGEVDTIEQDKLVDEIETFTKYFALSYPIKDVNFLKNNDLLLFAYENLGDYYNKETNSFTKADVVATLNKFLGNEIIVTYQDIDCYGKDGVLFTYDDNKETYTLNEGHNHEADTYFPNHVYFLGSEEVDDDTYEVAVKIVYCAKSTDKDLCNKLYDKANGKVIYNPSDEANIDYEAIYDDINEKLNITIFTMEKDSSGNMAIKSVRFE